VDHGASVKSASVYNLHILQSAILRSVDRPDVIVFNDVDELGRQVVVKMVLDAVNVPHVAHTVRHTRHASGHYTSVHLVF